MQTAKILAEAVIPNEYGIDPAQKLRIGSKICNALLGKLLADLANMRDESLATAVRPSHVPSWLHLLRHDTLIDGGASTDCLLACMIGALICWGWLSGVKWPV